MAETSTGARAWLAARFRRTKPAGIWIGRIFDFRAPKRVAQREKAEAVS